MRLPHAVAVTAGAVAVATALAACSSGSTDSAGSSSGAAAGSGTAGPATLTVFAAASLQKTFETLGKEFTAAHPQVTVKFSFGGSSSLVTQLSQGAPADVFASADTANMEKARGQALLAGDPKNFASNTLTIATPKGNPAGVQSFADLARPDVSVVVCAVPVPCGSATEKVEKATGIMLHPVSEEDSVTSVLTKVRTGQADAGLVYTTDAKGAGDAVTAVDFPEAAKAVNTYPIATLKESKSAAAAQQFVDFVLGTDGQKELAAAGFSKP
ncbi:molybdate ABC transporter substrate-binding protein [Tsukamurella sp. 8F]|uniref:molybdate ABC transporter substrate-binding protein n=1 Tax=unclassified Tsukamurella TaxID=2633480 RepID=UPI0023B9EE29|nr:MULTISPECIES: molybdate ABC transporter substrate-binding protein [unclassified Tsukamurella]MDF0532295.1 molybdate ABC transporter substrate-binding protein [Tsukamurella sp. 8J]MDF0589002.1 molybdate ABC transporter substrate-binding protein [Tsukamurella sp. 8F]